MCVQGHQTLVYICYLQLLDMPPIKTKNMFMIGSISKAYLGSYLDYISHMQAR